MSSRQKFIVDPQFISITCQKGKMDLLESSAQNGSKNIPLKILLKRYILICFLYKKQLQTNNKIYMDLTVEDVNKNAVIAFCTDS